MKDIINLYFISSDWKFSHRKMFVEYLHKRIGKTIVIQYPVSLSVNLFYKFKDKLFKYIKGGARPYRIQNDILVFTPIMLFHKLFWEKNKLFAIVDSYLISLQINRYLKKKFKNCIICLWVYHPLDYYLSKYTDYDILCYDYYDNHEYDVKNNFNVTNYRFNEKLVPKCDLINCVSEITASRMLKINKNTIKNVNGFNTEIFNNKIKDYKNELDKLNKPIIGYSGVIRDWLDFSIFRDILENTEYYLVCIGYVDRNIKSEYIKLKKYENFIHIDFKPISEIPNYIQKFNVGILPYKINKFTDCIFPLKFFEYMAMDIPIVSTNLAELKKYDNVIEYSLTREEFINNCVKSIAGLNKHKIKGYSKILCENTMDKVFDNIESKLIDVYKKIKNVSE